MESEKLLRTPGAEEVMGFNLEQGESEASVGHQPSGDTEFVYMRLKETATRKRRARQFREKQQRVVPRQGKRV